MARTLVAVLIVLGAATACSSKPSSPGVPTLSAGAANGGNTAARREALHRAAECIRQHGVPNYQDPILTSDGHVYTDTRALDSVSEDTRTVRATLEQACGPLIRAAEFEPDEVGPAPPKLVEAGVKTAQCLRANGLTELRDPTADSPFTPGHGFALSSDRLPNSGGKGDPMVQHAMEACSAQADEEIRQSSLGSLGGA
jgi:hypothetical protein